MSAVVHCHAAEDTEPRRPLPGESFDGYLAYRAAHALMPGPHAISSLGGAVHAHYPQLAFGGGEDDGLDEVAEALALEPEELRSRAHPEVEPGRRRFHGSVVAKRLVERRTRRFSPASLAKSPHHRALWQVRCLPFCEESWETLVDSCHAAFCRSVQRWRRSSGVDRCDQCGTSLLSVPTDMIPYEDQKHLRLLCGLLHHDPARVEESLAAMPPPLEAMPPGDLVAIACAVAGLHDPDLRSASVRHPQYDASPLRIASAMAEAARLLLDWPRSGGLLASRRLAGRSGRFGDGNDGATLDFIALADSDDGDREDPAARAATMLATALRENDGEGLPIKQAVLGTGLNVVRMAELRRSGGVGTVFHLRGDRIIPLIANRSLARLRRDRGVSTRTVAARLGIAVNGVEQLMLADALLPASDADMPPFDVTTRVDVGSFDAFLDRLAAIPCARPDPSWPTLAEASRWMGGDLKPWGAWFRAILAGSVAAHLDPGDAEIAARLRMPIRDAMTMRIMRMDFGRSPSAFSRTMSKQDAAATLNLHHRHAREAFDAWPTPEDRGPCVPIDEVRRLAAARMASSEIGALLGTSAAAASRRASVAGLDPTAQGYDRSAVLRWLGIDVR